MREVLMNLGNQAAIKETLVFDEVVAGEPTEGAW
jgi:hypothetical protein